MFVLRSLEKQKSHGPKKYFSLKYLKWPLEKNWCYIASPVSRSFNICMGETWEVVENLPSTAPLPLPAPPPPPSVDLEWLRYFLLIAYPSPFLF